MANTKSALKQWRQNLKRRARNRPARRTLRSYVGRAEVAVGTGRAEPTELAVKQAIQALDKAAEKKIVHPNKAARTKSRLMKKLNAAGAATS